MYGSGDTQIIFCFNTWFCIFKIILVALFEFRRGFVFSSKFWYIFLYSLWMFWVVGIPKQFHIVISHNCNPYVFDIYLLKVNNRNSRTTCEIFSKLTVKTPERHQWWRSFVFVFNLKPILYHFLVFILLTLSKYLFDEMFLILANVCSNTYKKNFCLKWKFQGPF